MKSLHLHIRQTIHRLDQATHHAGAPLHSHISKALDQHHYAVAAAIHRAIRHRP